MNKEPRITPSKIGSLAPPDACLRCYWNLMNLGFKKHLNFGAPAIMQHLDKLHKQLALISLKEDGELPKFFGNFRSAVRILNIKSMSAYHRETGLHIYGMPDLVLENADGSRMIVDNKTAARKQEGDSLFYNYRAQVNFYGLLCELAAEAYRVRRVGLLHYEFKAMGDDDVLDSVGDDQIAVYFTPRMVEVEYDPENIVVPLLRKVRELLDMDQPPPSKKKCADCSLIEQWSEWISAADALTPQPWMNSKELRECEARIKYRDMTGEDVSMRWKEVAISRLAEPNGVLANWNFDEE